MPNGFLTTTVAFFNCAFPARTPSATLTKRLAPSAGGRHFNSKSHTIRVTLDPLKRNDIRQRLTGQDSLAPVCSFAALQHRSSSTMTGAPAADLSRSDILRRPPQVGFGSEASGTKRTLAFRSADFATHCRLDDRPYLPPALNFLFCYRFCDVDCALHHGVSISAWPSSGASEMPLAGGPPASRKWSGMIEEANVRVAG